MKYRFWLCVWAATAVLRGLCMACSGAVAWFARRASWWADVAEIEMLLARTERTLRSKVGQGGRKP